VAAGGGCRFVRRAACGLLRVRLRSAGWLGTAGLRRRGCLPLRREEACWFGRPGGMVWHRRAPSLWLLAVAAVGVLRARPRALAVRVSNRRASGKTRLRGKPAEVGAAVAVEEASSSRPVEMVSAVAAARRMSGSNRRRPAPPQRWKKRLLRGGGDGFRRDGEQPRRRSAAVATGPQPVPLNPRGMLPACSRSYAVATWTSSASRACPVAAAADRTFPLQSFLRLPRPRRTPARSRRSRLPPGR
jgi:hypothetical protein